MDTKSEQAKKFKRFDKDNLEYREQVEYGIIGSVATGWFKDNELIEGEVRFKDGRRMIGKFEEGECFKRIDKNGNESYSRLVLESFPSGHRPISFEEYVASKLKFKTKSGLMVQSIGEQKIADFLIENDIDFNYDKQITLTFNEPNKYGHKQEWVRPDFYLPELAIVIEYWGMKGEPDYDNDRDRKEREYIESRTKFISIEKRDLIDLENLLNKKLRKFGIKLD